MDDGKATVYGLRSTVCFSGVVARAVVEPSRDIEGLRGRNSAFEPREAGLAV